MDNRKHTVAFFNRCSQDKWDRASKEWTDIADVVTKIKLWLLAAFCKHGISTGGFERTFSSLTFLFFETVIFSTFFRVVRNACKEHGERLSWFKVCDPLDVRPAGKVLHDHLPLNSYAREIEGARNLGDSQPMSAQHWYCYPPILHHIGQFIGVLVISRENGHVTRSYNFLPQPTH